MCRLKVMHVYVKHRNKKHITGQKKCRLQKQTCWKMVTLAVTPVSPRPSNKYQADEILYFILGVLYKYVYLLYISILV
ncbi:hypothetical protein HanPI659440_Chr06g0240761 [Helianthus annuus]|nr:hypothetical protein HanPI659440_Chr06g0240761 [Helianthus annuus]